jgi:pSer/pThr/pTyr-binding forkhead associated (FHA) protein/Mg-chelatase subunit ChlD
MIYRLLCFSAWVFALALAPAWAEDEDLLTDPAIQAVEALGAKTTEPVIDAPASEPGHTTDAPAMEETAIDPELLPAEEFAAADAPLKKDVVLVLDNSGSMKKNDPQFIGKQAAEKFIQSLDGTTRVAVIIFDKAVKLVMPLTEVNDDNRVDLLKSLDQLDYKGPWTESPAAVERAIYELKTQGRSDAQKSIVFMTDGEVDTGDKNRDIEQAKWLRNELAADAANNGIKIFGIAYTDNADFLLIQSIAQQTGGEYYRVFDIQDLQGIYEKVTTLINRIPEPEPEVVAPAPPEPPPPVQAAPPPAPVIIEVPVPAQRMDEEEELRSKMILVALSVLIVAVIIMVLMLIRGSRKKAAEDEYAQEAYLNDINNYTSQTSYKLGSKPTMLGRVAGTDTDHLNYIVIPQTTIGRRHALIEYKDFAYWIIDQGSINGTFVNDQMITSETRLKHGDRVRLHKYEFEFIMPEMVEAGMTMISKTVMATSPAGRSEEPTVARGSMGKSGEDINLPEPDFDLTGGLDSALDADEEDTVIKGSSTEQDNHEPEDATLMLDSDGDEMVSEGDDATIRPDKEDENDDDRTLI